MLQPTKKDSRLLAAGAYLLHIFIAFLIYLVEKEDKWVRFHALQAILFHLSYSAVFFVIFTAVWLFAFVTFGLGAICIPVLFVLVFGVILLNLWFAYRAYKEEYFELPLIGKFAAAHV